MAIRRTPARVPVIGELRNEVILQSFTTTRDGHGDEVTAWKNVATVWAKIEPLGSEEEFEARAVQQEVSHRIVIRHIPTVKTGWRIYFNDPDIGARFFLIVSARDLDSTRRFTIIMAEEEKA